MPVGFTFQADQGKVALAGGNLGGNPWIHSYTVGLTLRADGFPQVYLPFGFGGGEGTHDSNDEHIALGEFGTAIALLR